MALGLLLRSFFGLLKEPQAEAPPTLGEQLLGGDAVGLVIEGEPTIDAITDVLVSAGLTVKPTITTRENLRLVRFHETLARPESTAGVLSQMLQVRVHLLKSGPIVDRTREFIGGESLADSVDRRFSHLEAKLALPPGHMSQWLKTQTLPF